MYNINYSYVEVGIDKNDDEILADDLLNWTEHLFKSVEKDGKFWYRGLIPKKELESLFLLKSVSPYGNGYEIIIDSLPEKEYGLYSWKVVRGLV